MHALTSLLLVVLLMGQSEPPTTGAPARGSAETPRQRSPLAPSLPLLTDEEEAQLDRIIDRFILYDTGKLQGAEGKKALKAFHQLDARATFALIRGINKAAKINHSCPALSIARKLDRIIRSTQDIDLLEYARENIGLGVEKSRHMNVIKNLKLKASLRKGQLQRAGIRSLRGGR